MIQTNEPGGLIACNPTKNRFLRPLFLIGPITNEKVKESFLWHLNWLLYFSTYTADIDISLSFKGPQNSTFFGVILPFLIKFYKIITYFVFAIFFIASKHISFPKVGIEKRMKIHVELGNTL